MKKKLNVDNYIEKRWQRTYHVGYEELKKAGCQGSSPERNGSSGPQSRDRRFRQEKRQKEGMGHIRSQKILLTWLIDRGKELFESG